MITEQAVVLRASEGFVELALERQSTCSQCELNQGCGTGAIGRLLGRRRRSLVVRTDLALAPGDRVQVGIAESALVKASLAVYGLPLLGLLGGGLVAAAWSLSDPLTAVCSFAGFGAGFQLGRHLTHRLVSARLNPHVTEIEVNPVSVSGS